MDIKSFKTTLDTTPWWICNMFEDINDVVNTCELLYKDVVNEFVTESEK